jgi:hypothetical protein
MVRAFLKEIFNLWMKATPSIIDQIQNKTLLKKLEEKDKRLLLDRDEEKDITNNLKERIESDIEFEKISENPKIKKNSDENIFNEEDKISLDLIQKFVYLKSTECEQENEENIIKLIESGKYEQRDKIEWIGM